MRSFQAAVVQMHSGSDKAANLEIASALVSRAAAKGAQLIALPEVFAWRGPQSGELDQAEPIPGPTTEAMSALARRLGIHLVAGSILELPAAPPDRHSHGTPLPYNSATLFGPDGSLLALYRKIHLFDVDLPGRVSIRESDARAPGEAVVCADTALGRLGLAVCYDLRFPELFRALADAGAEVVVMPSAFTRPTGEAHWETLLRARAIENQCFVLAPNQHGLSTQGFADHGHSLVVDPWGTVLACGSGDRDEAIGASLDAEVLERVRRELPSLRHRRLGHPRPDR
jgi:predicted amidohydrolase